MKDWESQPIQDNKMYKHWLSLCPEDHRASTAVIECWKDMISMFKHFPCCVFVAYYRFIISFNDHKIVGSTGDPKWFQLLDIEQNEHIKARSKDNKNKPKKVMITAVVDLILDPNDRSYLQ